MDSLTPKTMETSPNSSQIEPSMTKLHRHTCFANLVEFGQIFMLLECTSLEDDTLHLYFTIKKQVISWPEGILKVVHSMYHKMTFYVKA